MCSSSLGWTCVPDPPTCVLLTLGFHFWLWHCTSASLSEQMVPVYWKYPSGILAISLCIFEDKILCFGRDILGFSISWDWKENILYITCNLISSLHACVTMPRHYKVCDWGWGVSLGFSLSMAFSRQNYQRGACSLPQGIYLPRMELDSCVFWYWQAGSFTITLQGSPTVGIMEIYELE